MRTEWRALRRAVDCSVEIDNLVLVIIFASRKQLLNRFDRKAHSGAACVFWTRKLNTCVD